MYIFYLKCFEDGVQPTCCDQYSSRLRLRIVVLLYFWTEHIILTQPQGALQIRILKTEAMHGSLLLPVSRQHNRNLLIPIWCWSFFKGLKNSIPHWKECKKLPLFENKYINVSLDRCESLFLQSVTVISDARELDLGQENWFKSSTNTLLPALYEWSLLMIKYTLTPNYWLQVSKITTRTETFEIGGINISARH